MMNGSAARGIFLVNLAVLGSILAFAVYQVPQPWRGVLVGWLLFLVTVGALVLRVLKHHYAYKTLQLTTKQPLPRGRAPRRRATPDAPSLKVIRSDSFGAGRSVIR
ncbi:MAG: hypothetical protein JXA74_08055 [Anaerolineae bacterium]|nr:hypothetical protein [Anaerolineae bacterium]